MAITVKEKWDGRHQTTGENPSEEVEYIIAGTDDDTEADAAMVESTPLFWMVGNWRLPKQTSQIRGRLTEDMWLGSVMWAWNAPLEEGDEQVSFDTTGGTRKVFQSFNTNSYAAPGATAPNFQGAIGVTDDGIEGVDIVSPALSFTIQRRFAAEYVTQAWIKAVAAVTGCYNDRPYLGYDTCELRFDGATGQQRIGKPWDISFKFTASENATDLPVGPITVATKRGWDYLWVRYRKQADTTAMRLVQTPLAAYTEQVLLPADFGSVLGIS